nr:MAG TPA: hypothetical protein [Caudoviricetes sp.]
MMNLCMHTSPVSGTPKRETRVCVSCETFSGLT